MGAIFGTDDVSGLINEVGGEVIISANTTVDGDLTVSGDLDFGDASVDVLTIDAPGQGEASAFNLSLVNDTDATVSLNQYSPSLFMRGSGWKINATAESQYTDGRMFMGAGDFGANAIGTMTFQTRTNEGAWSSHFTINQYGVQSNVATYLNENTIQASNRTLALNSSSDTGFKFSTPQTVDSLLFFLDSTSRSVILTDVANSAKDHDHAAQTHPTIFVNSATSPDTSNVEWGSLAFVGTGAGGGDFTISTGVGNIALAPTDSVTVDGDVSVTGDIYTTAWTDYTASSTITGWVNDPPTTAAIIKYKLIGKLCYVVFYLDGTSNATTVGFTLPYTSVNDGLSFGGAMEFAADNSNTLTVAGRVRVSPNTATANCFTDMAAGAWTNSNNKFVKGEFFYEVA